MTISAYDYFLHILCREPNLYFLAIVHIPTTFDPPIPIWSAPPIPMSFDPLFMGKMLITFR